MIRRLNPLVHIDLASGDIIALSILLLSVGTIAGWVMHALHQKVCFFPF